MKVCKQNKRQKHFYGTQKYEILHENMSYDFESIFCFVFVLCNKNKKNKREKKSKANMQSHTNSYENFRFYLAWFPVYYKFGLLIE
jgi:hypothetical protein